MLLIDNTSGMKTLENCIHNSAVTMPNFSDENLDLLKKIRGLKEFYAKKLEAEKALLEERQSKIEDIYKNQLNAQKSAFEERLKKQLEEEKSSLEKIETSYDKKLEEQKLLYEEHESKMNDLYAKKIVEQTEMIRSIFEERESELSAILKEEQLRNQDLSERLKKEELKSQEFLAQVPLIERAIAPLQRMARCKIATETVTEYQDTFTFERIVNNVHEMLNHSAENDAETSSVGSMETVEISSDDHNDEGSLQNSVPIPDLHQPQPSSLLLAECNFMAPLYVRLFQPLSLPADVPETNESQPATKCGNLRQIYRICEHCSTKVKAGRAYRVHLLRDHRSIMKYFCKACGVPEQTPSDVKAHLQCCRFIRGRGSDGSIRHASRKEVVEYWSNILASRSWNSLRTIMHEKYKNALLKEMYPASKTTTHTGRDCVGLENYKRFLSYKDRLSKRGRLSL